MSSAVWSTPMDKMKDFPAKSLVRFFNNHGFVGVNTQLQWKTVDGGSREYRNRIMKFFENKVHVDSGVKKIKQKEDEVIVQTSKGEQSFDKVVVATHADEALSLLENPLGDQVNILNKFSYQENKAVVHSDENVMPKLKKNWSSWNFMMSGENAYTVYYMNRLQGVSDRVNFFVNINGQEHVTREKIIQEITYHHPVFDVPAVNAQKHIDELNKNTNLHFTGSYYRYGFHEDALLSSVKLCSSILNKDVLQ